MTVMTMSWKLEETWEGRWWEERDRKLGVEDVERQRTRWTSPHRVGWVEESIVSKKWKKKQQDVAETAVRRVWRQRERGEAELEMSEEDDEGLSLRATLMDRTKTESFRGLDMSWAGILTVEGLWGRICREQRGFIDAPKDNIEKTQRVRFWGDGTV